MMRVAGIILAAGLSSRMEDFKPLMDLGGKPLIAHTVLSLQKAGIREIVVVTGKNADAVKEALQPYSVRFLHNPAYAATQMLDSFKIGLAAVQDADAVVMLPADMPAVAPDTIQKLIEAFQEKPVPVQYPVIGGRRGHPPIIHRQCFSQIFSYEGEGGLRGALQRYEQNASLVEVTDAGVLLDADTKADFETIKTFLK